MTDTPEVLLHHHLKKLRLPTFLTAYAKLAKQCAAENKDHVPYLLRLCELELIERRIKAARFPATKSLDRFVAKYGAKYEKASAGLVKDRDVLLAFYDFRAEPWQHVRSTNPIESTFATVRLRTNKTRGCLSRDTALAMVFKLVKSAERHWRRLNGTNRIGEIIEGVKFKDEKRIEEAKDHATA